MSNGNSSTDDMATEARRTAENARTIVQNRLEACLDALADGFRGAVEVGYVDLLTILAALPSSGIGGVAADRQMARRFREYVVRVAGSLDPQDLMDEVVARRLPRFFSLVMQEWASIAKGDARMAAVVGAVADEAAAELALPVEERDGLERLGEWCVSMADAAEDTAQSSQASGLGRDEEAEGTARAFRRLADVVDDYAARHLSATATPGARRHHGYGVDMAKDSSIEWTHHTFNPWWGCVRVSPGCVHCYAETFDKRVHGKDKAHWGVQAPRRFFGDKHWNEPLRWDRVAGAAGERHRVFCASMADVFEDRPELVEPRTRLFALIEATPNLDWLLLTKRPENMVRLAPERWAKGWPPNVWAGCTVEDQQRADERVPVLLSVPAAVRFLSCEPLLEAVDLLHWIGDEAPGSNPKRDAYFTTLYGQAVPIGWVIIGGESGHGSRPFDLEWAREIVRQCREAKVAPFVKQLGARPVALGASMEQDDAKGGDWSTWPEDLRVREFPASPAMDTETAA